MASTLQELLARASARAEQAWRADSTRAVLAVAALAILAALAAWWWLDARRRAGHARRPAAAAALSHGAVVTPEASVALERAAAEAVVELEPERLEERAQSRATPPEVERLALLAEAFESGPGEAAWEALLAMGDVYRRGAYPRLLPNEDLAAAIYSAAAACPDGQVAGLAQARFIETRESPIAALDRLGEPLPAEFGERALEEARLRLQAMSLMSGAAGMPRPRQVARVRPASGSALRRDPTVPTLVPGQGRQEVAAPAGAGGDDMDEALAQIAALAEAALAPAEAVVAAAMRAAANPRSDSQNVHDHGVVAALRARLAALADSSNDAAAVDGARAAVLQLRDSDELSAKEASDALLVLDNLGTTANSSLGVSEQQALGRVWRSIGEESDPQRAAALRELLAKQLATGVEHGHVVCSTGKITRIAATFDGVAEGKGAAAEGDGGEAPAPARPMWAVRQELMALAARVRSAYLEELPVGERAAYEAGGDTGDGQHEAAMRARFEEAARAEYIDTLGFSAGVVAPLIEEAAAGF